MVLRSLRGHVLLTLEKRGDIALQVDNFAGNGFSGAWPDEAAAKRPGKNGGGKNDDGADFHEKNLLRCVCFSDESSGQGRALLLLVTERPVRLEPDGSLFTLTAEPRASKRLLGHAALSVIEQLRGCPRISWP